MTKRILLIGSGAIADYLVNDTLNDSSIQINTVGLREFQLQRSTEQKNLLSREFEKIIYLGFHKQNLRKNLTAISRVTKLLKEIGSNAELIFASSHVSIAGAITSRPSFREKLFTYTRYFYVRRAQEWLVSRQNYPSRIIYIPIVTGLNDNKTALFDQLLRMKPCDLPNLGKSRLFLVTISKLSNYLLRSTYIPNKLDKSCRRVFLYSNYLSLKEYLEHIRPSAPKAEQLQSSPPPSSIRIYRTILTQFFRELILFSIEFSLPSLSSPNHAKANATSEKNHHNIQQKLSDSRYIQLTIDFDTPDKISNHSRFMTIHL